MAVEVDAEITAAVSTMLEDALEVAENSDARLVVVMLDTPGGEVSAVEETMNLFESSTIPVCVFVYPMGASAWSGGTYLLVSSHVAAMASGSTIGSAQPVLATGQPINDSKRVNALTALMMNHARLHGRNATVARLFVTENLNLGPEEALRSGVVEIIADDLSSLLEILSGMTLLRVRSESGSTRWMLLPSEAAEDVEAVRRFDFTGVDDEEVFRYRPGARFLFLQLLYDPLVSGLMFTLSLVLLLLGIQTPGLGAELAGGMLLLLSLVSFQVVGVEPAALFLLILGFVLIVLELEVDVGLIGVVGAVCLVIGSFLLLPSPNWLLAPRVLQGIRNMLLATSVSILALFGFIAYKVAQSRGMEERTGPETMDGSRGMAFTRLDPVGEIRVGGEYWRARAVAPPVEEGAQVVVEGRDGLLLLVRRSENSKGDECSDLGD